MRLRRLVLASFLVPAMLMPGCRCVRTPAEIAKDGAKDGAKNVRQEDEMQKHIQEDLAKRDDPSAAPSASPGGTVFDVERRLEELRENFAGQRWEAVEHDATALVTAGLDEITKLEVIAMLLEALRNLGERERAREMQDRFNKLYADLKASEKLAKDAKARERISGLVARIKGKAPADRFAAADGEPRTSYKLAEKLKAGGDEDVLESPMPDGGTVYFSRSGTALEAKCNGVSKELGAAIQREPEFGYYFAIAEAPPPTQKK